MFSASLVVPARSFHWCVIWILRFKARLCNYRWTASSGLLEKIIRYYNSHSRTNQITYHFWHISCWGILHIVAFATTTQFENHARRRKCKKSMFPNYNRLNNCLRNEWVSFSNKDWHLKHHWKRVYLTIRAYQLDVSRYCLQNFNKPFID